MPTLRQPTRVWLLFAVAAIGAWLFSAHGWASSWYIHGLFAFLLVTFGLAVLVFVASERNAGTAGVLALSLLIANWALAKMAATVAMWSVGGLAP